MNEIIVKESEPDDNGIITRIEYRKDENGKEYKIIKKLKRYTITSRVYKSVEDRKNNWVKFGLATGDNNVTFVEPEEILMEPPSKEKEENIMNSSEERFIQSIKNHGEDFKKDFREDFKRDYKEVDIKSVKHIYEKNTFKVFGIDSNISEVELYELFSSKCFIKQIYIPRDWKTKESKCFAYISFLTEKDMETCFNIFNDYGYNYLRLKIEKI